MTQYQPHTPNRIHSRGFTLVELMVTIAVMGIIAAIAAPSFSQQLANKRIDSTSSTIEESIRAAISESAIRRQPIIYKIDSTNKAVVLEAPATPPSTSTSVTIATFNYNDNSEIAFSNGGSSANIEIKVGPGKRAVNNADSVPIDLTLTICDLGVSGETPRKITINALAQVRQMSNGSCS